MIRFIDPAGNEALDYRAYAASGTDGIFSGSLTLAANDLAGKWDIEASIPLANIKKAVTVNVGR